MFFTTKNKRYSVGKKEPQMSYKNMPNDVMKLRQYTKSSQRHPLQPTFTHNYVDRQRKEI